MLKIKSISIQGFRRSQGSIHLDLNETANFLIGRNGTGKTTLINLINACLTVGTSVLTKTAFETVLIKFKGSRGRVPSIEIIKLDQRKTGAYIQYRLKKSAAAVPEEFFVAGERRARVLAEIHARRNTRESEKLSSIGDVRARLSALFSHTWLSLHRFHEDFERRPHYVDDLDGYAEPYSDARPGVDRKLHAVLDDLQNYCFRLDKQVSDQVRLFQKEWFRSFLASGKKEEIGGFKIDFKRERAAIASMLERFEVPASLYEKQLDKHIELARAAQASIRAEGGVPIGDFFNLYDAIRLHRLVEQWQELQERQREILKPKDDFVEIVSKMLFRKKVSLTEGNTLEISTQDNFDIDVDSLSSGEKQLIIFLAETLLQEKKEVIFLADEPELSLHVEWQEQLVKNLLQVNPNAQMLFATHSPDIVGAYSDNIFSMENLVT
ncbi:MAG: AAA family ATPase [Pseudomonadota bacterium]